MPATITVKLLGGLGNQLFEWAYGRALQSRGYQVEYDISAYTNNRNRQYWLTPLVGDLPLGDTSCREIYEPSHRFHPEILNPSDGNKMTGYWQTEQYFINIADEIRQDINFRWMQNPLTGAAKQIEQEIFQQPSVFMHVRRQDYVGLQDYHGLLPIDYYLKALDFIRSQRGNDLKVFVFSDDIQWCQQHLSRYFRFVTGTNMYEDIRLMACCKHAILANSSFSWWGCWLGDNQFGRTVIAPKQWFVSKEVDDRDLVPSRWTRI